MEGTGSKKKKKKKKKKEIIEQASSACLYKKKMNRADQKYWTIKPDSPITTKMEILNCSGKSFFFK